MTIFSKNSSRYGLEYGEFDHLSKVDKRKLLKLMARIMERAYRRGVQQAITLYENGDHDILSSDESLHSYRYDKSIDISYGIDGYKTTSIDRLMCEEHLDELGF